jgi:hypothetical protein
VYGQYGLTSSTGKVQIVFFLEITNKDVYKIICLKNKCIMAQFLQLVSVVICSLPFLRLIFIIVSFYTVGFLLTYVSFFTVEVLLIFLSFFTVVIFSLTLCNVHLPFFQPFTFALFTITIFYTFYTCHFLQCAGVRRVRDLKFRHSNVQQ